MLPILLTAAILPFGGLPARQDQAGTAMAPDGRIVFARVAPDGALEVRERPAGGPVGAPATIAEDAAQPHVLIGVDGTAAVLFDADDERYAWREGHDPEPLGPAGAGAEGITSGGEVWRVAPAGDRLTLYRAGNAPILLPAPSAGARDTDPALSVPRTGGAHVVYVEEGATAENGQCVGKTVIHAVDIAAAGTVSPRATLDSFTATGTGTAEACAFDDGELIDPPLLLGTDARGADTVVYGTLAFDPLTVTPHARHRDPGAAWPGAPEPLAGGVPELLVDGRGLPLLVLRSAAGESVSTRRPDGSWTAPAPLGDARTLRAARTGHGTTILAWSEGGRILARVTDPDGVPGALAELAPGAMVLGAGGDDEGNGVALFSQPQGDEFVLAARGFDAAGPRVTAIDVPSDGPAREPLTFAAAGLDVWSGPVTDVRWDFGDGEFGEGVSVRHAYAEPGGRIVTVSLRDALGNSTESFLGLEVTDALPTTPVPSPSPSVTPAPTPTPPVAAPPADTRAPVLSLRRGPRARTLIVTTDERARLAVTLTRGKRHHSLTVVLRPGRHRVTLPRLSAGTWKATATATDAAGNRSDRRTLRIRVPRVPQRR